MPSKASASSQIGTSLLGPVALRCPWATARGERGHSPEALAREVVRKMTLREELGIVDLRQGDGYENINSGVKRLCIPPLTLQDGPNGLAFGDTGVTQLPASLGLAATFDPSLARRYGQVIGEEARGQGVDVVQGPNLNLDRLPTDGRNFETYGEDPYLASVMGVADISGIQSAGALADAKHFTAYTQETARLNLDQILPVRTLAELYLPPFKAAVERGRVASIMCAYGQVNAVYVCQSRALLSIIKRKWRFPGFIRSDLGAVNRPVRAFSAGLDAIKPGAAVQLRRAIASRALARARLDGAVVRILSEMFRFGLIEHPLVGKVHDRVTSPGHAKVALAVAERSIVLLKNNGVLPFERGRLRSIAVIGADAGRKAMSAGFGSAHVIAPFLVTPLDAIRRWMGRAGRVVYVQGAGLNGSLPAISSRDLRASVPLKGIGLPSPRSNEALTGGSDLKVLNRPGLVTAAVSTASQPGHGPGWLDWKGTLVPPHTGLYQLSLTGNGDSWLTISHHLLLAEPGLHGRAPWSTTLTLRKGRRYPVGLRWFEAGHTDPRLGWHFLSGDLARAVQAARRAKVAIVFASDWTSEGFDRPNLSLPGALNDLIDAVASANPRTVVVLNTGGPVLMPWLSKVAAVLEAWYPGEQDGAALVPVLAGAVDPRARLPITFPRNASQSPTATNVNWPGVNGRISLASLDIGYRRYQALRMRPLFPFGFGLSYTKFRLSLASAGAVGSRYVAEVRVTNVGARRGTEVVEAYLGFPPGAGEPPRQLRAFALVTVPPGETRTATLSLGTGAFECFLTHGWQTVPGNYHLEIGTSSQNTPIVVSLRAP